MLASTCLLAQEVGYPQSHPLFFSSRSDLSPYLACRSIPKHRGDPPLSSVCSSHNFMVSTILSFVSTGRANALRRLSQTCCKTFCNSTEVGSAGGKACAVHCRPQCVPEQISLALGRGGVGEGCIGAGVCGIEGSSAWYAQYSGMLSPSQASCTHTYPSRCAPAI